VAYILLEEVTIIIDRFYSKIIQRLFNNLYGSNPNLNLPKYKLLLLSPTYLEFTYKTPFSNYLFIYIINNNVL